MTKAVPSQASLVESFRALHAAGCFLIPNSWDTGSAIALQHLGAKAIATSSAGVAFARGLPDTVTAISRDDMLAYLGESTARLSIALNADFQSGYADAPEDVAANVKLCVGTGVAGLSIEDVRDAEGRLYERPLAVERIRAARAAIDASGIPVVLTARCEAYLVGHPDAAKVVLDRLVAYADAGADCLFAPGIYDALAIAAIVKAVAPKPVNVLLGRAVAGFSVARLADLGVRRVSVGSAFARVAWGAFLRSAKSVLETGSFESFEGATAFAELNRLFEK